ncbi:DUF7408 domain-containing protein [Primorskyibacter sp. S187A]|uniref:DUF7408 domain-containing protein n=1 Tax=Primorskyibacter sp. S187A TaxID=3415130 RepID=UPI003C7989EF
MTGFVVFDPMLPWPLLAVLGVLVAVGTLLALWRGLSGWAMRGLGGLIVLAALAQPAYQQEERAALSDIVVLLEDRSASQGLAERGETTQRAADELETMLTARSNTEVRRIVIDDAEDDSGTQIMSALNEAMAREPRARLAGVLTVTDGLLHDVEAAPDLPAPMQVFLTGKQTDWDRRLTVSNAPAFAILGEPVTLTLRVEDEGAAPATDTVPLLVSIDGAEPQEFEVPLGRDIELPITLPHAGRNVLQFVVPEAEGELTDRNNSALVQINGVRDRLRVLLVSGEPHPGGRTWRNLLKSDSSVDLVHFTILRPPEKQDGVPVRELSLIAFPTRELFLEKVDDFDLIIFDRYKRRGILPSIYLDNVSRYVEEGGAVLIAAGPDFASADSLYRSPLSPIVPASPTARVLDEGFDPTVTEIGERHPVTSGLGTPDDWGRWLRQIEVEPQSGHVVMSGIDERPLLVLDRVGEGRVALMASDHAWLWSRGFEGGGPQLELLRRLAHWMMGEPELEEETLTAEANGQSMRITRRTLQDSVDDLTITGPDGSEVILPMEQVGPGQFETRYDGPEIGLYRLREGDEEAVIGLGPAAPREFERTIATGDRLEPIAASMRGGVFRLEDGVPRLREVREGRPAAGRGWFGITPRNAFDVQDVRQTSLLPPWLVLLLASLMIVGAWLREGRS